MSKKPVIRQSSQTRKSSDKDKISAEQKKKRSSSTGKVASSETKHINSKKTDEKVTRERKEKENVEAIDIPVAEVEKKDHNKIVFIYLQHLKRK